MIDEELRALEREIKAGEPGAEERYIVANRRRTAFDVALGAFLEKFNEALRKHFAVRFPGTAVIPRLAVDPRQGPRALKNVRIVRVEGDRVDSAYCFVERETGTILKCGGWKAPEPKRIPRGSIYASWPIRGCGPHGVAYADGSGNCGWAPGVFVSVGVPVRIGPSLPVSERS
jgi:hypothetical protein